MQQKNCIFKYRKGISSIAISIIDFIIKNLKDEYGLHLTVGEMIESGSQANIYSGKMNSKQIIVKICHNDRTGKGKDIKGFNNEVELLSTKELGDAGIIPKLYYSCFDGRGYIIMENLVSFKPVSQVKNWTYDSIRKTFVNLMNTLVKFNRYAVHKDIKDDNVMIDENNNIKFIDFGLSNVIGAKCCDNMFSLQDTSHYYAYRTPMLIAKYFTDIDVEFSDEEIAKHDDLHACICMMFFLVNKCNHVETGGILNAPSYLHNLPKDISREQFKDIVMNCIRKSFVEGDMSNEINSLLDNIVLIYNENMWKSYDFIVEKILKIESLCTYT